MFYSGPGLSDIYILKRRFKDIQHDGVRAVADGMDILHGELGMIRLIARIDLPLAIRPRGTLEQMYTTFGGLCA